VLPMCPVAELMILDSAIEGADSSSGANTPGLTG
jgi:hypothetical protein